MQRSLDCEIIQWSVLQSSFSAFLLPAAENGAQMPSVTGNPMQKTRSGTDYKLQGFGCFANLTPS